MVRVQFPKSESNPYWDGTAHIIAPLALACINGSDYYYMEGFDFSFNKKMCTLLRKTDDSYEKVPLDDYKEFCNTVRSSNLSLVSKESLGHSVGLAPEMTVADLKRELGIGKKLVRK